MCHSTNYESVYNAETDTYDFSPCFVNVSKYISKADISLGNLETTFAGEDNRGYSGYPEFNTPSALGQALKDMGLDIVSTANNHSLDRRFSGVENTLNELDSLGIAHTGTSRTEEEQNTVLVRDVNGIKIAFLSFTYGTNGIPVSSGKDFSVNIINDNLILQQIALAKEQNVDMICVSMHWGDEYSQKINAEQKRLTNLLFENGVDLIIGNHAHVVEPMEKRTVTLADGTEKDCFVAYALGNFISGQVDTHTKSTIILDMKITKNGETGKISIDSVDYIPVYCYDRGRSAENRYELLDIRDSIAEYESGNTEKINENVYSTLKSELNNIESVVR